MISLSVLLKLNSDFTSLGTYPFVLAVSMMIVLMTQLLDLIIDLSYVIVDPKVNY